MPSIFRPLHRRGPSHRIHPSSPPSLSPLSVSLRLLLRPRQVGPVHQHAGLPRGNKGGRTAVVVGQGKATSALILRCIIISLPREESPTCSMSVSISPKATQFSR